MTWLSASIWMDAQSMSLSLFSFAVCLAPKLGRYLLFEKKQKKQTP
jgi:hypothetical protein